MLKKLFINLFAKFKARKAYHDTFSQINSLTDRDLRDIGISRSDIYWVAKEAAEKQYHEVISKIRKPNLITESV